MKLDKNKIFDYHINDSRNLNSILDKKIVDVIITSPPYWNLKDYGSENQIGFGQRYDKYLDELVEILDNAGKFLKDEGSMWIIVDSFKKGGNIRMLPFEITQKLQEINSEWHLQDIIIWQKDKTLPWSAKGKLRNIFEYVLFFTKSPNKFNFYIDELREVELTKWWPKYPERYNPKGKVPSRVWEISIPVQGWGNSWVKHFCPFPPELIQNILLLTTKEGDVVLDIFAGSGSVLAQSKVMKRKAIGFDLNSKYKKMYAETVIPYYKELWKNESKNKLSEKENIRNYLGKTIPLLRKTKFAFSLGKELKKVNLDLFKEICFVYAINKKENEINYFYIVKDKSKVEEIFNQLNLLSKNKEMNKFSLKPKIVVIEKNDFFNEFNLKEKLFVYKEGCNNYYSEKIQINDLLLNSDLNNFKKMFPLITNIQVNQKDSKIN